LGRTIGTRCYRRWSPTPETMAWARPKPAYGQVHP
jgi:hypothetical protein